MYPIGRPVSPPVNSIQPSLFRTPSANKPQSHSSNNEPAATNSAVSDYTIADPSEAISSAVAVKEETLPPASTPAPQKPAQPANLAELLKKDMPEVLEATPEIKPERKIETTPSCKTSTKQHGNGHGAKTGAKNRCSRTKAGLKP